MALMPIRIYGDPVLRKKAKPVRDMDGVLSDLIETMVEAMCTNQGVGLAAPQVGKLRRIIVVRADAEADSEIFRLINPRIVASEGTQESLEGCLSLPALRGKVNRHEQVAVEAITLEGDEVTIEATGLLARVLEHEIDHLNGVLFVNRADLDTLCWLIPDTEAEDGYRFEPTTMEEAQRCFERMRRKRQSQGVPEE